MTKELSRSERPMLCFLLRFWETRLDTNYNTTSASFTWTFQKNILTNFREIYKLGVRSFST